MLQLDNEIIINYTGGIIMQIDVMKRKSQNRENELRASFIFFKENELKFMPLIVFSN